jgi:hypothetical protein
VERGKSLGFVVLALAMINTGFAADLSGHISGIVHDSEGAIIKNATVFIHRDSSSNMLGLKDDVQAKGLKALTDENGRFKFDVSPGFYDVFVVATAFSPECAKVRVKAGENAGYNPRLKADPLVSKELGHEISSQ